MEVVDADTGACRCTAIRSALDLTRCAVGESAYGSNSGEYRSMRMLRGPRTGRRALTESDMLS